MIIAYYLTINVKSKADAQLCSIIKLMVSRLFPTQPNPELSPPRVQRHQMTQPCDLPLGRKGFGDYVDSLDCKIKTAMYNQLITLKNKHLELGEVLSSVQAERARVFKESKKREQELRDSFQSYLLTDVDRFKNHKDFFQKNFILFSSKLNQAMEHRDKLLLYCKQLRNRWSQIKKSMIKEHTLKTILPRISQQLPATSMKTSKTLQTTQSTERSVRVSTEIGDPMSPILTRMGGSQPVLGSRIHQPIKRMKSITKKTQTKKNIHILKEMLEQKFKERQSNGTGENPFEDVLFQRRNFYKLMKFFDEIE